MDRKDNVAMVFAVIKCAGREGICKTKLTRAVQRRLDSVGERDAIVAQLFAAKSIAIRTDTTGGRPVERYYSVDVAPPTARIYGGTHAGSRTVEDAARAAEAVNGAVDAAGRVDAYQGRLPASPVHAVVLDTLRRIDPFQAGEASVNALAETIITLIRADIRAAVRDVRVVEELGVKH